MIWATPDGFINLEGRVRDNNYFGIGFGDQMDGSDMIIFFGRDSDGNEARAGDFVAPGYKSVNADA